jgi:hypothetical protein
MNTMEDYVQFKMINLLVSGAKQFKTANSIPIGHSIRVFFIITVICSAVDLSGARIVFLNNIY